MARRQNPIDFDVRPGAREGADLRTRTGASMFSPVKHRAITEVMANSPHNFFVVLKPRDSETWNSDLSRPDGITLVHVGTPPATKTRGEPTSESVYTAFTYLHRLGDETPLNILTGTGEPLTPYALDMTAYRARIMSPQYKAEVGAARAALVALLEQFKDALPRGASSSFFEGVAATRVNSKMVREGYARNRVQATSDLFALCELTPASRPLLRPFTSPEEMVARPAGHVYDDMPAAMMRFYDFATPKGMALFNAYFAQHNILWRAWYDAYIRNNYGAVVRI